MPCSRRGLDGWGATRVSPRRSWSVSNDCALGAEVVSYVTSGAFPRGRRTFCVSGRPNGPLRTLLGRRRLRGGSRLLQEATFDQGVAQQFAC
jgi:hypothetical protein